MKVPIYTVAVPVLAIFAFAQDNPPSQSQSQHAPTQMKTQTWSGTLVDASCAGASSAATPPSPGSCNLTASSSQFALKMKDGRTLRLDDVGNLRVQEAMKTHKQWSDSNKPVHVKASGIIEVLKMQQQARDAAKALVAAERSAQHG